MMGDGNLPNQGYQLEGEQPYGDVALQQRNQQEGGYYQDQMQQQQQFEAPAIPEPAVPASIPAQK